jgi:hypothetical protein
MVCSVDHTTFSLGLSNVERFFQAVERQKNTAGISPGGALEGEA